MTPPMDFQTRMAALDFATKMASHMELHGRPDKFLEFVQQIEAYLQGPPPPVKGNSTLTVLK